jgi:hypothetical protein
MRFGGRGRSKSNKGGQGVTYLVLCISRTGFNVGKRCPDGLLCERIRIIVILDEVGI